jgi:hypothetical protein
MIKSFDLVVSRPEEVKDLNLTYFTKSGFRYVESHSSERKWVFRRGSFASNMWTFNALQWKSLIEIELNGAELRADFQINTVGQLPTYQEELLWDTFIGHYRRYLQEPDFNFISENSKMLNSTKNKNLKYVGWALLGGLIGGIPAALIAHYTKTDILVPVGAALGAMTLMIKKINDEKQKNNS